MIQAEAEMWDMPNNWNKFQIQGFKKGIKKICNTDEHYNIHDLVNDMLSINGSNEFYRGLVTEGLGLAVDEDERPKIEYNEGYEYAFRIAIHCWIDMKGEQIWN